MGYSVEYVVGAAVGLLVGVGLVALLFKMKVMDLTFDERQERTRGMAYKYGFWTLVGCLVLYGLSEQALGRWCESIAGVTLCICVAGTVFASVCIVKDAYLSLKEQPRKVMLLLAAAALLNLGVGVASLLHGGVVQDGVLTARSVNLICGVTVLVIMAVYTVNWLAGQREDAE